MNINHPIGKRGKGMKSILTKREREVFKLLVENKTTSDIA